MLVENFIENAGISDLIFLKSENVNKLETVVPCATAMYKNPLEKTVWRQAYVGTARTTDLPGRHFFSGARRTFPDSCLRPTPVPRAKMLPRSASDRPLGKYTKYATYSTANL